MSRKGKCSESVQSGVEVYMLKGCVHRHGPVIVQCTDSVVFPRKKETNMFFGNILHKTLAILVKFYTLFTE